MSNLTLAAPQGSQLRLTTDGPARPSARLAAPPPPMILHGRVVAGSGGGPDKTILRSAQHFDPAQFRVGAAYIHPVGDSGIELLRHHANTWGCPLWEIAESGPLDPRTLRSLVQLCQKLRVTVWHGHDYKSNLLGLVLRGFWPMKLVTTVHGWTRETVRTRLYYHVDNFCLPRYDHVFAVSPQLVKHCHDRGVAPERLTYLPNAIDPDEFRRGGDSDAVRGELGVAKNRVVIGVVGRFSPEKGVERAIRTLADLRGKFPAAELHLIGDGPEAAKLNRLARGERVDDAVRFWGWQPNLQRFYEMMDLLLLPSYTEGLPNVVLEAMAMGVPVAATDVGGVSELLENGRCGVVLNQDQSSWANHIAPLLVSADRRAELARRGRLRIEDRYSFALRMRRETEVYRKLLKIRGPMKLAA